MSPPQNRIILFAVFMLVVVLASMCVESFILQELPLYRAERNLETAAFDRAVRSNNMAAFNNKRSFREHFFFRNIPYRYYD